MMERTNYAPLFVTPDNYKPPDDSELIKDLEYPNLNSLTFRVKPVERTTKILPYFDVLAVNDDGNAILGTNELSMGDWNGSIWSFENFEDVGLDETKACYKLQCDANVTAMQYVQKSIFLAALANGELQLWSSRSDLRDAQNYCPFMIGGKSEHAASISSLVVFDQNDSKVASGSRDGTLKIWDIGKADLSSIHTMRFAHTKDITGLSKNPKNQSIFGSCSWDGKAKLWDQRLPRPAKEIFANNSINFTTIAWWDHSVFLGTSTGKICSIDIRKPNEICNELKIFNRHVRKIQFNNNRMAVIGLKNTVKAFQLPNLEKIYENSESTNIVRDIVWSKVSKNVFYTIGWDSKLRKHSLDN